MTFYNKKLQFGVFFSLGCDFYNKSISGGNDRRFNNSATAADRTDENLSDRIIKLTEVLKTKKTI